MKYMLLIHHGDTPTLPSEAWDALSPEEQGAVWTAYGEINAMPGVTPGERMHPPEHARTVRVLSGRTVATDGPFAEAREAVGGYFFYETDDPDAVVELAGKVPAASMGGWVEIRQLA